MPQQVTTAVENNFTKGLITEATGLNFPENASTATDNCLYTLIGDVLRREGIDNEVNGTVNPVSRVGQAISTYKWNNAGGDGLTQVVVEQVGGTLYFYRSSTATVTSPLSSQQLTSTINITSFFALGGLFDPSVECQYSDGNGYLFVYHPDCDPFYCTYTAGVITGNKINVQIRDFTGIPETGIAITTRPSTLTAEHTYNLTNQGWTSGGAWSYHSSTNTTDAPTSITFAVSSTAGVTGGDTVNVYCTDPTAVFHWPPPDGTPAISGTVASFVVNTSITVTPTFAYGGVFSSVAFSSWQITQSNQGHIDTWKTDIGNYPSNADVWWYFKDTTNVFNPTTTAANVTLSTNNAPQGHYILNVFNQQRGLVSGVSGLTDITTPVRPRTGAWFQGRVWYTGVDAQQAAVGDEPYFTWTESIYFSQIVQTSSDFGSCYQQNDPTSENFFDLLPSDGGVIVIPGCGSIYKLFALQNAMLVFAANGVWYITGSTGIGFTANDYTVVKLSAVRSISSTSFVDVNGIPYFWNEEGIYAVEPAKQGTSLLSSPLHVNPLEVIPITLGTILTFYNSIPLSSKQYARAAYDPLEYIIQWVYRDTEAPDVTGRYTYNKILNFNVSNQAFFPYTVDTSVNSINGIVYVASPGGINAPDAAIKYVSSNTGMTFADEHDTTYVDWGSINYVSYFITGYKLRGQAIKKFQPQYIQVYSRTNGAASAYKIQGIWDYANDPSSGRWSSVQEVTNGLTRYDTVYRRHKIRGHGYALQFKIFSVDSQPFDIQGWATVDTVNQGT